MTKDEIRKKYLDLRKTMPSDEVLEKSTQIFKRVSRLPILKDAKIVSLYLHINNEVDTKELVNDLLSKGKKVFLPRYANYTPGVSLADSDHTPGVTKDNDYSFAKFTGWDNLEKGPFGILQPIDSASLRAKRSNLNLDVAIFPGVAFGKNGVRLGYGKGVFDRLLEKSNAFKIGLAYDFQIADYMPRENHDLVVNMIVTESRTLVTKN